MLGIELNEATLGVILGLLIPPIVSLLKNLKWRSELRFLVSLAVCLGAGAVSSVVAGSIDLSGDVFEDPDAFFTAALAAFASSQTVYRLYFRNTALNDRLTHAFTGLSSERLDP